MMDYLHAIRLVGSPMWSPWVQLVRGKRCLLSISYFPYVSWLYYVIVKRAKAPTRPSQNTGLNHRLQSGQFGRSKQNNKTSKSSSNRAWLGWALGIELHMYSVTSHIPQCTEYGVKSREIHPALCDTSEWLDAQAWRVRLIPASIYDHRPKRSIEGPGGAAAGGVENILCQVACKFMFEPMFITSSHCDFVQ